MSVEQNWLSEAATELFETLSTENPVSVARKRRFVAAVTDLAAFLRHSDVEGEVTSWHLRRYFSSLEREGVSAAKRRSAGAAVLLFMRYLQRTRRIKIDTTALLAKFPKKLVSSVAKSTTGLQSDNEAKDPAQREPSAMESLRPKWISARQLRAHLDTLVVGQVHAKVQLSVLFSMHLSWFNQQRKLSNSPNAILMGPTGVGKTHTIRTAAAYLGLPFVSLDATSLVPSGILGYQMEDVLGDLVKAADEMLAGSGKTRTKDDDIELARRGVIFFDEFDKLAVPPDRTSSAPDGNHSIQRRLLKLVEGAVLGTSVRQHSLSSKPDRVIDTSGILVLAGGAFAGIEDNRIRSKRPEELKRELSRSTPNLVVSADIINYGFIPELVARLPVLIDFVALEETDLTQILDIPEISPLQVWLDHFQGIGKAVTIDDEAKRYAARMAISLRMGARGLQQVIFPYLAALAYEVEGSDERHFTVTADHIRHYRRPMRPSSIS